MINSKLRLVNEGTKLLNIYTRHGYCSRCGQCCNIRNFTPEQQKKINKKLVFDKDTGYCTNLDIITMLCRTYPNSCTPFPKHPDDICLILDCTYYFTEEH